MFRERKKHLYNIGSIFVGVLITLMLALNGVLSSTIGDYSSVFIIHAVGILFIVGLMFARKTTLEFKKLPWHLYSAGAIGIFIVVFNNLSFNRLGASVTIALGLVGQLIMSSLIDSFGMFGMKIHPFKKKKLIGIGLMVCGTAIMMFL